jgi:hypothetical protein
VDFFIMLKANREFVLFREIFYFGFIFLVLFKFWDNDFQFFSMDKGIVNQGFSICLHFFLKKLS